VAYLLLFKTITKLYHAEEMLRKRKVEFDMMPVPEHLNDDICGEMALRVQEVSVREFLPEIRVIEYNE